jgi:hypothetical protein
MYPDAVSWLNLLVKRWKVRYADRKSNILAACYRTGKLVIVSTDMPQRTHEGDGESHIREMYCVPEYPPKALPQAEWSMYDGFSSHYPDWHVPATEARHWNLEYLEVHVMLDEYAGGWDPIDKAVSLNITDLRKLVKEVKG